MTDPQANWTKALVSPTATLQEVIGNLNDTGLQITLVADADRKLLGTVTDGDIRRALLRGIGLADPVSAFMFTSPKVLGPNVPREIIRQTMAAAKIHQIPFTDTNGALMGLHVWDEIVAVPLRENIAVIMAGGFGKRLRPLTDNCPKPLLPLDGKPILEHVIDRLKGEGFYNFVISVFYLGEMIEAYFGDGSAFGARISYLRETDPLGTAGALSLIEDRLTLPFVVTNGDVLTDIRYGKFLDWHVQEEAAASMAVRRHEIQNPFGVVNLEGNQIVGFEEKPTYLSNVNAGIYTLNPEALGAMQAGAYCDMPTLFDRLRTAGQRTCAFPMHENWIDLGRHEDLQQAAKDMA